MGEEQKLSVLSWNVECLKTCLEDHTGLWLRTGCVTNAQVSVFERTGF